MTSACGHRLLGVWTFDFDWAFEKDAVDTREGIPHLMCTSDRGLAIDATVVSCELTACFL